MPKIRFLKKSSNPKVVVKMYRTEKLNDSEIRYFSDHNINYIIPPIVKNHNKIIYNPFTQTTLRDVLLSGISIESLIAYLIKIITAYESLSELNMNTNSILFDMDYIFIDTIALDVNLIYIPVFPSAKDNNITEFINCIISVAVLTNSDYRISQIKSMLDNKAKLSELRNFLNNYESYPITDISKSPNMNLAETFAVFENNSDYEDIPETISFREDNEFPETVSYSNADNNENEVAYFDDTSQACGVANSIEKNEFTDENATVSSGLDKLLDSKVNEENDEMPETVFYSNETEFPETISYRNDKSMPKAFLIRLKTNETIIIDKPNFVIGKNENEVDYCIFDNMTVSRKHASILTENENEFFFVDEGSSNKSFIEGVLAEPNKKYRLFKGSRFYISNEEFLFKIE